MTARCLALGAVVATLLLDALIATLERAVEALPDNQFFSQTLQRLRGN